MTIDLRDLYQEVILDHSKKPRNFRQLPNASLEAKGHNPLCGDRITVQLVVDENSVIQEVGFQGAGCAISTASASMMTEVLQGKSEKDVEALFEAFHELATGKDTAVDAERLGKLAVFAGVREYPVRVKCATLAWHTMRAALADQEEAVSTE